MSIVRPYTVDDQDLVSHLYDAGVSIEGTAPQRQSLLLSLILGYVFPIAIFVLLGRWAQQEDDEFHGQWWPWRHDVLW